MDYTSLAEGNEHPNQHDYDMLAQIYAHADVIEEDAGKGPPPGRGGGRNQSAPPPAMGQIDFDTPAQWGQLVRSTANGRGQTYVLDFGGGNFVVTHVLWVDAGVPGR